MKLKRIISILISLSLLMGVFQSNTLYAKAATNGYYTYTVSDDGTITITDCDDSIRGTVYIPSSIGEYPVTCIGECAFKNCDGITNLIIPNSVRKIGQEAFSWCDGITNLVIPNSVTEIGASAFACCDSLTSVKLSDNAIYLGECIFTNCEKLANVEFGKNMTNIGPIMFSDCESLVSIEIPDNITHINYRAFAGCYNLKSIKLGNGVTTIGANTFAECPVEQLLLPETAINLHRAAFAGLNNIKTIWLPEGVKIIPESFFYSCDNLLSIRIPDSVTSIEAKAFYECYKLKSVYIPSSVTYIEPSAFVFYSYGPKDVVIYCEKGSYAENFAIENNIPYVAEDVLSWDYNEEILNNLYSTDMIYKELGICAPEYLHNNMVDRYISDYHAACSKVLNDYSDVEIVRLAFLEGFVKGTDYISNKLLSFLRIQSSGEKRIEEAAIELLQEIEKEETVIYDSWKVINKTYKDIKFAYQSTETLSKAKLVEALSETSQHLTSETITKIVDSAYKDVKKLGISKAFDATGKAFDIVDLTVYCCQLYDAQMETIDRLISCSSKDSVLYEGLVSIKKEREKNASSYVIEKFLQKEIASELEKVIGKVGKYATTKLASMDVSVLMAVVTLTSKVLYNYVYQGPKVTDINKAIIFSDFYNSISIALANKRIELMDKKVIKETPSQQLLDEYRWLWNTRLSCLKTYAKTCANMAKNDLDKELLNNYNKNYDEIVGFENYILNCYNEYRHAINENKIKCSHYRSYKLKTVQATCTTSSYSLYRCITCGDEYANEQGAIAGHIYVQQIVEPTCTNVGYTIYICQNCRHSYKSDYVDCIQHDYIITDVAATCTANGYTKHQCSSCELSYIDNCTEAYGHSYGEWKVVLQPTPERVGKQYKSCENCSENFIAQIPKIEVLSFSAVSLALEEKLDVNYKVNREFFEEEGYEKPYVRFIVNGRETVVKDYVIEDEKYVFTYKGIAPHQMNDVIYAVLCAEKEGTRVSGSITEYSIGQYCYNMLETYASEASFRTLLVDLLNYGAAAQLYMNYNTENLVNDKLTDEQKMWASPEQSLNNIANKEYVKNDSASVLWKSVGLNLKDAITLRFKIICDSVENLSIKVSDEDGEIQNIYDNVFEKTNDGYYVYFGGLSMTKMREPLYITIYKGEKVVSDTLRYSVESYAYTNQNGSNYLGALMSAMMKICDSMNNYMQQ